MSMKRVAGITALITAMAFVNNIDDLTIVGENNICYAKVVRKVTRNIVIQKKTQFEQATQDAQDIPTGKVVDTIYETSKVEDDYDNPETEKVELKETEENTKLKEKNDLNLITVSDKNTDFRLGDTTTSVEQYINVNSNSGFKVVNDISNYSKYDEYLNNGRKTYVFTTKNFSNPITEPLTINGNLIIEAAMYIALQSNNYELTVTGNLIIAENGSIRCCMEKANDTGTNTIRVDGNIVFDGQAHKMSLTEQSYGFSMPLSYARSTQSLKFSSSGTWYAVNGKTDDYYNVKDVANKQTKYITDVKKPDVSSVFEKNGNGDVNGDGIVNDADVELLKKYLINVVGDKDINKTNADVNGDGKITLTDLSQLKTKIDENKVKSPLIELTDEEINTKYAQYKKYLIPNVKTYYCNGKNLQNRVVLDGNLIIDKQLKIGKGFGPEIRGSLILIGNGSASGIDYVFGNLVYNPSKNKISEEYNGTNINLTVNGDVYIISNPYENSLDKNKYGNEIINIDVLKRPAKKRTVFFYDNAFMDIGRIGSLEDLNFLSDIYSLDDNLKTELNEYEGDISGFNYILNENDMKYIQIKYYNLPTFGLIDDEDINQAMYRYRGRLKALIALMLQDEGSIIEGLPFLRVTRNANRRNIDIVDCYDHKHYSVELIKNNNLTYKGILYINSHEIKFDAILTREYFDFKSKFRQALISPQLYKSKSSGYAALIRSIFESGFKYYAINNNSSVILRKKRIETSQRNYFKYPIVDCVKIARPYIDLIFMKGQRPYDYGIKSSETKSTIESDLEDKKLDYYKKVVYIFKDNKDLYKPENTEKTLNNLKNYTSLTNKVVLHNEVYKAFLLPIAESISKADIKKYNSQVGTKFTLEICKMIANGIKSLPKQIVKVNRDTYEIEYDINLALYGLGTSSATIKKNGAYYTQILFTNVGTQDGVKALCEYASALGILSKDTVENAAYELITYGLKDILHYSGALELKNIKQFGQGLTDAILSDSFAKQFAVNAGGKVKEYLLEKGEAKAKAQLIGLIENYIPNGKAIVETAQKINELENKKIEYEKNIKTYHESSNVVEKIEAEYWLASAAISKLLSTM